MEFRDCDVGSDVIRRETVLGNVEPRRKRRLELKLVARNAMFYETIYLNNATMSTTMSHTMQCNNAL